MSGERWGRCGLLRSKYQGVIYGRVRSIDEITAEQDGPRFCPMNRKSENRSYLLKLDGNRVVLVSGQGGYLLKMPCACDEAAAVQ